MLFLRAKSKGLRMEMHIDDDVPDDLIGDAGRLRQVIVNLVGIAIKFTDQGHVLLEIHLKKLRFTSAFLHFSVTDTGIGAARFRPPPGNPQPP